MNGKEFIRRARRYARRNGFEFSFHPDRGKGSHGEVRIGGLKATVQHGEIPPPTFAAMLKELNINRREF